MKSVKFQLFPSKFCNLFYWSHPCIDPFFIGNQKIQFLLARVHMKKMSMQSPSIFKTVQCCAQSSVYQNKALVYYSWLIGFVKSTSFWKSEDWTNTFKIEWILKVSKNRKKKFQTKLLPQTEPSNLFLEEVLARKFAFEIYWPLKYSSHKKICYLWPQLVIRQKYQEEE